MVRRCQFTKKLASVSLVPHTISMKQYQVENYKTASGEAPFRTWFDALKDDTAQAALVARLRRAEIGNLGDWKAIAGAKGLCEMRLKYGPGYRVYYTIVGQKIVLLLAGSTKQGQDKAIAKAKEYLAEYNRRVKQ